MLRAPICSTSAYSATSVDVLGGDHFGDDGQARFVAGGGQQLQALFLQALEAVGLVRGLNAPPRRAVAPAAFTARAVATICSSLSTEQGPAMTPIVPPPTVRLPARTTVGSVFTSRLASL